MNATAPLTVGRVLHHYPPIMRRSALAASVFALAAALAPQIAHAQPAPSWPDLAAAPATAAEGAKDAALIIGVEDYVFVPRVPGAAKNATDWFTYLVDGRKVPIGQVKLLRNADATREGILGRAAEVAAMVKAGGTVWVVFIGHGAPAADGKEGVLIGVDAQQKAESLYARSVRQSELSAALGGKPTVMVLDACFSGRAAGGGPIAGDLQPLLLSRASTAAGMTLLSAGKSDQFAGPLPGLGRPAFSYLVLGALRGWGDGNRDGTVTAQEAVNYAAKALTVLPIGRAQTPELVGGSGALVLAKKAAEKGPNLTALVSAVPVEKPVAAAPSFGEGLGKVVDVPTVGEFKGATAAGGLADLDPDLLVLVQEAKRTDAASGPTAEKARAWDAVARYSGKNAFKADATARRDQWAKVAAAEAAKAEQLDRAWGQYQRDKAKLEKLQGLDATVLSEAQKAALARELEQVYAPWQTAFGERVAEESARKAKAAAEARAKKDKERGVGAMAVIIASGVKP